MDWVSDDGGGAGGCVWLEAKAADAVEEAANCGGGGVAGRRPRVKAATRTVTAATTATHRPTPVMMPSKEIAAPVGLQLGEEQASAADVARAPAPALLGEDGQKVKKKRRAKEWGDGRARCTPTLLYFFF
jgi:hypothetical protein